MKIRQGFVSNSSSSSFLVLGVSLNIKDITFQMIKEKNIICVGRELSDGVDIFDVDTLEKLALLKALDEIGNFNLEFIEVYCQGDNDNDHLEFDLSNTANKKIECFNLEQDYHCCENFSDIRENYDPDGDALKIAQRYIRAKKIKKIEKNIK